MIEGDTMDDVKREIGKNNIRVSPVDLSLIDQVFKNIPTTGNQLIFLVAGDLFGLKDDIKNLQDKVLSLNDCIEPFKQVIRELTGVSEKKGTVTTERAVNTNRSEAAKKIWADRRAAKAQDSASQPEGNQPVEK